MGGNPQTEEIVLPTGGGCMRPWIWPGGKLHIRPCGVDELRVGDIAVWFNGTRLLSHRVIAIREDGSFVTRGDWYERADAPAEPHQLVGVAVRFSRGKISYPLTGLKCGWILAPLAKLASLATPKRRCTRIETNVSPNTPPARRKAVVRRSRKP